MTSGKLVQVVQHLRPGGIEKLALDFITTPPIGDQAIIVSLEGDENGAIAQWPELARYKDHLVFMGKRSGFDACLPFRLAVLFRRVGARFVHTHHIGPLLYAGLACRLATIRALVHTEHDAWHLEDVRQARMTRLAVRILKPRIVADAMAVAENLKNLAHCRAGAVILNGIDTEKFAPSCPNSMRRRLGLPIGPRLIGLAGRLEAVKNQGVAIEALKALDDGSLLVIAGSGSGQKSLQNKAVEYNVEDRVIFLGFVQDMPSFYNAIDLYCLPSNKEGLPLSLFEAQACGTPVVASNVGGVKEATCSKSGRLIDPHDVGGIVRAWRSVLSRSDASEPRAFALREGSRERMLEAYKEVFQN